VSTTGQHDDGVEVADNAAADGADERPPVVDWGRTGRRMAISMGTISAVVVIGWLVLGVVGGELRGRLLGELVGLGLLVAFVVEVVVVGGAALRGMLRAGDRGDRLAGNDVSVLPPQILRRGRR
jgi:hypothetical protein